MGWAGLEKPESDLNQNIQNVWSNPVSVLPLDKNVSAHYSNSNLLELF